MRDHGLAITPAVSVRGVSAQVALLTRKETRVAAPHPPEFRRRAVELARRGDQPISLLAKQLRISEACLHRWVGQAYVDENGSDSRLTSAEKRELAQLRREKRRLERENQILKQAIAYFAREDLESLLSS